MSVEKSYANYLYFIDFSSFFSTIEAIRLSSGIALMIIREAFQFLTRQLNIITLKILFAEKSFMLTSKYFPVKCGSW